MAQDGTVIPKGTVVVLVPQTLAAAVILEGGKSLAEILPSYAAALAGYQAELVRLTSRETSVEMELAELRAWAVSAGFKPSNS